MVKPTTVYYAFDPDDRKAYGRTIAKDKAIKNNVSGEGRPARSGGVLDQLKAGRREVDYGDCPF